MYLVIVLDENGVDDMSECLVTSCTNLSLLSKITDIKYDRLVYIFTKLRRKYLHEQGHIIFKINSLYLADKRGGGPGHLSGLNR